MFTALEAHFRCGMGLIARSIPVQITDCDVVPGIRSAMPCIASMPFRLNMDCE